MGSRSPDRQPGYWMVPASVRNKAVRSLGDALAVGHHVWIRCLDCGHGAVMHPAALAQIVGYDCSLVQLEKRLRCSKCARKRVRLRAVEPGERG